MASKMMKLIVVLIIVATSFASKICRCRKTEENVTDVNVTEGVCSAPACTVTATGQSCFIAEDPTGCTAPRCVCGFGVCLFLCPRRQCPPGATLYRPPYHCACPTCVCLPKRCAKCDPNNTTIPQFPSCNCPTCHCVDGQCINDSSTTESVTTL